MHKRALGVMGIALVTLVGCSTTKATSGSVENRIQALENRVQVLETDAQPLSVSGSTDIVVPGTSSSGVTAETMTKKQVQEALKNAGYYDGAVDGKIGPKTKAAITEFQKDNGLTVDGVSGRKTKEKLLKYL